MNTVTVAIALVVMVTLSSGLDYNSYKRYPSAVGNSWNSFGSRRGLGNNGFLSVGHHSNLRRYRRAAVGYGSFDPYYGNNLGGHIGAGFLNKRLGGLGSGRRLNSRWNTVGY